MTEQQPRENNGRYDEKTHSAPEVELHDSAGEPEGSFLFPPSEWPGGVSQYVEFWKAAPIDDDTLSNLANAYGANRDEWEREELTAWAEDFGNSSEAVRFMAKMGRTPADYQSFYQTARAEKVRDMERQRPRRIPMTSMRAVARAGQMQSNWYRFDEAERAEIAHSPIHRAGDGDTLRVKDLWHGYRLNEILPDGLFSQYAMERKLDDLREEIARMRHSV